MGLKQVKRHLLAIGKRAGSSARLLHVCARAWFLGRLHKQHPPTPTPTPQPHLPPSLHSDFQCLSHLSMFHNGDEGPMGGT